VVHRYNGIYRPEEETWDYVSSLDLQDCGPSAPSHLYGPPGTESFREAKEQCDQKWVDDTLAESDHRCKINVLRFIDLDRILGVDEVGDDVNPGVHLYVEFDREHGRFTAEEAWIATDRSMPHHNIQVNREKQISFFSNKQQPSKSTEHGA